VLSHLPPKQIFGVQRVSRLWRNVIARSPGIQEKLFLKLQSKPAELWALFDYARGDEFEPRQLRLEKITSESEVEPGSTTGDTLFTPVALNPFLQLKYDWVEGVSRDIPICNRAHYLQHESTGLYTRLTLGANSTLMDTQISDPPCMRAQVALSYYFSPENHDLYRLEACFVVQTGKPLTLRDTIAETWTDAKWISKMTSVKIYDYSGWSNQDNHWGLEPEHERDENDEILELASLADIITRLEIVHGRKLVVKREQTVIMLDHDRATDFGAFPLVPTEADRHDVVAHDKNAYAALIATIEADEKEREAAWRSRPPMSLEELEALLSSDD